jgi:hypothetical protein
MLNVTCTTVVPCAHCKCFDEDLYNSDLVVLYYAMLWYTHNA